jgi:hypothetical protein
MAIPQIAELERFLSSISIDPHAAQEGHQFFDVIPAKLQSDGHLYSQIAPMSGSYLPGGMKFDSVLKRLGEEVRKSNHLANDSMLRLLLGMSAVSRPAETPAVAHFNYILDKICECDYSNFLIGCIEDKRETRMQVGNSYLGEVDIQKVRYRCRKVKCDYFRPLPESF